MQNIAIQVQDDYVGDFMNYVNNHSDNIVIKQDKNLELDPYFYERQKKLHQIRDDIKSGKMEMLSEEQYEKEIEQFFLEFEK
ncbi:hypothetical protein JHD46_00575 [Sulfurimonas sp. SAG-AH-194-C20]|nr:hypothetical protein [Sulfurimonas sp. SAG-AH-194-C20]MDF1878126.1 hypothetical protein [Sulfurimonas sp. SAG-AH-194-C20]